MAKTNVIIYLVLHILQSVHHFNCTLVSIQRDIEALTKFAAIGFDGLPLELQPVLASVQTGTMPKKWRPRSDHHEIQTIPLDQGLQGIYCRQVHDPGRHLQLPFIVGGP